MNNLLITGGAGFIGSNFINMLFKNKINNNFNTIINIDKLTYAANPNNIIIEKKANYIFYQADICDNKSITDILEKHNINYIINFAAESHVDNSIINPDIFVKTNILGTANLLTCAKKYWNNNFENKKFIQISTDEVYGSLTKNTNKKFTERSPIEPHSPYSASKAGADLLALSYHHTYNFPVVITRCSNNYGENQHKEKLIPLMIYNAINNIPLPVYGDGKNIRDWIYVEDHCNAILKVLESGKTDEIYNIGANSEKSNIEIVNIILEYLNKPKTLIKFVEDRLGHDRRYAIDATKIILELNWKPIYSFNDGIIKTIEHYHQKFSSIQFLYP
jgi:dTDP-glucose 4,6-dehydratase